MKTAVLRSLRDVICLHLECRTMLLPLCLAQLKHHMVQRQELMLCGKILGELLKELHANRDEGEVI